MLGEYVNVGAFGVEDDGREVLGAGILMESCGDRD